MEMDEYSVNEGDGVVEVCAQLMVAPADGLQCNIVATLTAMQMVLKQVCPHQYVTL